VLEPYRVLDLTDERGLICGEMLGDLGADVIVIEPPGGSSARRIGPFWHDQVDTNTSLYWWSLNRNKRGITCNLETEQGRDLLRRLTADADFLVESFEPGAMAAMGLGYDDLAAINPKLIMVSITPFGQTGPKAHNAATDLTVLAASHQLLLCGDTDRPPVRVAVPQAFLHAGAEGAVAALIALFERHESGLGQHIDISAQASAMMATQSMVLQSGWGDRSQTRSAGGVKLGPIHLRFVYPCADGYISYSFLFGTAIGPATRRMFEWMYAEGAIDEELRDKDWINYTMLLLSGQEPTSELYREMDALAAFFATRTKEELFREAMRRGLLIAPVATTADVFESEQLRERQYWTPVEHPRAGGTVTYPGPFAKFSEAPITYRRPPPELGEHNEEVYRELLNLGVDDVIALRTANAI
jgi:crotonobetainyl-CoA:carnitine CoA-transferase CaiB-like acyl-CoA transferase